MSFLGKLIVVLYLMISALVLYFVLFIVPVPENIRPLVLTVVGMMIIAPLGTILLKPFREKMLSYIYGLSVEQSVYRICIFGRSGTGKTTLIETAFTWDPNEIRKSTQYFDFCKFKVQLQKTSSINDVAVADYKGQNPSQIILYGPSEFFGNDNNRLVNAVLFMVDLVPKKVDQEGNSIDDEALLKWLKNEDTIKKIEARIQDNYDYISESALELFFAKTYSKKNLKSVKLLINKVDLVDKLINDGHITLSNFRGLKEYSEYKFKSMIKNIDRACSQLEINDFSVHTISAKSTDDLKPIISKLLRIKN